MIPKTAVNTSQQAHQRPAVSRAAASDWPPGATILRSRREPLRLARGRQLAAQLRGLIHQLPREAGIVEACLGVRGEVSD